MLLKNSFKSTLLMGSLCFLCVSCATAPEQSGPAPQTQENTPHNDARSQEKLGMAYLLGRSVAENDSQAFYWFQKAAEKGSPTAANELAYLYASGKGVEQNYPQALHWYEQAAEAGLPSAKYNLGLMYAYGLGTPVDQVKANELFREAAAQGFAPAKSRI